jgi:hypothetical protein
MFKAGGAGGGVGGENAIVFCTITPIVMTTR